MDEFIEANRRHWDDLARIHIHSENKLYDIASVRRGETHLDAITDRELGGVRGKSILHLQCHFGLDSLRLAQRGARVTGVDLSGVAIDFANTLAADLKADARFIEANVYDAPKHIDERFDIVFVTWGALCWLPDIPRWAEIVCHFLNPGGFLFLLESHPVTFTFIDDEQTTIRPHYNYFGKEPVPEDTEYSYAGAPDKIRHPRCYAWDHPISNVVNALLQTGLTLGYLHEHDRIPWQHFKLMQATGDGHFSLPPGLPLAYSLQARKA